MPNFIRAIYHPKLLTVEYVDANGDHLLRSGGTIAWRFNNPGNLRPGSKYTQHIGQGLTKNGSFLIFPTVEAGRIEKKSLLLRKYQNDSLEQMVRKYAPSDESEEQMDKKYETPSENDTDRYINFIQSKTGLDTTSIIGQLSEAELENLIQAMERFEGFYAKTETRKEKWVRTTKITLSDGARPLTGQEVTLKQGDNTQTFFTDEFGQLPAIAHLKLGEQFEIWAKNDDNNSTKIDSFSLGDRSQSFTYFKDHFFAFASTRTHLPSTLSDKKTQAAFSYVVQPGDTLGKISNKFKISVSQLQTDNQISNPNKIFPGQRISIYGKNQAVTEKPQNKSQSSQVDTVPERSKQGQGQPLEVIPSDQKRAPWMEFALYEAKRFSGAKETDIQNDINYHTETGATFLKSMSGTNNAWCASFVNWSLQKAGYKKWKNSFRARAVIDDKNFVQLDEPVYGAITIIGTHHACLVYSKDKNSDYMVCLGGNQSDQINFTVFKEHTRYFIPLAYFPFVEEEKKLGIKIDSFTASELNVAFGIKPLKEKKNGSETR